MTTASVTRRRLHRLIAAGVLASCAALAAAPASAETFPTRPVRMIVPFPAGGSNDLVARIVADKLQAKWGQNVFVENKTGAGGNIGAESAAQAEPDGYTLLVSPPGPLSSNIALYKQLSYRPSDFVPVSMLCKMPNVVLVRRALGVKSVGELVAYLKKTPSVLGSQGNGSTPHLTGQAFMKFTGTTMTHVPYRGEGPVINDMLGGRVDLFFGNIAAVRPFAADERLQILAITDTERSRFLPDVPTFSEAGLPAFQALSWFALALPPKTPAALRDKIAADVTDILKMPDVIEKFRAMSIEPFASTPDGMAAFVKSETERWSAVIRENGITAD